MAPDRQRELGPRPAETIPEGVSFEARGEGALGPLVWSKDWSATPLGPIERWPRALVGAVHLVLALPTPAIVFWGPDLVQLYNDGYAEIMGPRHPRHLGSPYRECWPDTYPTIHPWMQRVLAGEVVLVDRTLIPLTRYGFTEEAFFSFTFSPLRDDDGRIAGILQLVSEMTGPVIASRRERTLRQLAELDAGRFHDERRVLDGLADNRLDVPFAVLLRRDRPGASLEPIAQLGFEPGQLDGPDLQPLFELARRAADQDCAIEQHDFARTGLKPRGAPYPEPIDTVLALPMRRAGEAEARGVLVVGANPRLRFDTAYRHFCERLAHELSARLGTAHARLLSEQLELTLDSAKMGRWHADLRSQRLWMSARTGGFLGFEKGGDLDFHEVQHGRLHPEDRERVHAAWVAAIEQDALFEVEYRVCRPDGELRWLCSWGRALRGPDGAPRAISGVTMDLTERKRSEVALREAVRARDEFISLASHELNTPLTTLRLTTQTLARALERDAAQPPAVERLRRFLQQTDQQVTRLSRLVSAMLDVARIGSGRLAIERRDASLRAVVVEAAERLRPQFEAASTPLSLHADEEILASVDVDRIDLVVTNLLTNAIRYGRSAPVRVLLRQDGEVAELVVEDGGPGIAPQDHARIFQRFERAISQSEASGLGLGLYIAQQLVEMHGGSIGVESAPGRGARFTVRLPRRPTQGTAANE